MGLWTLIIDKYPILKLQCHAKFCLGCVYLDYNATTPIFPEVSEGENHVDSTVHTTR